MVVLKLPLIFFQISGLKYMQLTWFIVTIKQQLFYFSAGKIIIYGRFNFKRRANHFLEAIHRQKSLFIRTLILKRVYVTAVCWLIFFLCCANFFPEEKSYPAR